MPSPSILLSLLNPDEFLSNIGGTQPGVGQPTSFTAAATAAAVDYLPGILPAALTAASASAYATTTASGLTASGTTLANAYAVSTQFVAFSTVASGTAAKLPAAGVANPVYIANFGASGLSVFPPTSGGVINALGAGAAYLQATGTVVPYAFFGGNQYYTET